MKRLTNLYKSYRTPLVILILILILAGFVRLYRISDYMHFLGDEGRDVLVVKRMIVDHKITLLGPITSVGSIYLGPIYYYFMTPFLFIFNMNPVGPAVMIALLSLATIVLIFCIGLNYFNLSTAVIASLLYALSPLVIVHSRFSWNPNAVPFFATLVIFSLLRICINRDFRWTWVLGISLGILVQLHYIAILFIPLSVIVLLMNKSVTIRNILKTTIGFCLLLLPFVAFEIKHHFPNLQTVYFFVTRKGTTATFSISKIYLIITDITVRSFYRIVVIGSERISKLLIIFVVVTILGILLTKKYLNYRKPLIILLLWFLAAVFSFGIYTGAIYDYYMVVIFPLPAILTAIVISHYLVKKSLLSIGALIILILIIYFQLTNSPLMREPNRLLHLTTARASFIQNLVDKKPYNFALITGSNSDHAYRYFLELWGIPPIIIENPQVDPDRRSVTEQLVVVCELPSDKCLPLGNPLWEIAGFGRADIEQSWEVAGSTIIKLKHYQIPL